MRNLINDRRNAMLKFTPPYESPDVHYGKENTNQGEEKIEVKLIFPMKIVLQKARYIMS